MTAVGERKQPGHKSQGEGPGSESKSSFGSFGFKSPPPHTHLAERVAGVRVRRAVGLCSVPGCAQRSQCISRRCDAPTAPTAQNRWVGTVRNSLRSCAARVLLVCKVEVVSARFAGGGLRVLSWKEPLTRMEPATGGGGGGRSDTSSSSLALQVWLSPEPAERERESGRNHVGWTLWVVCDWWDRELVAATRWSCLDAACLADTRRTGTVVRAEEMRVGHHPVPLPPQRRGGEQPEGAGAGHGLLTAADPAVVRHEWGARDRVAVVRPWQLEADRPAKHDGAPAH